MGSDKKNAGEKDRQRLETLQNTEKKFLKGMYGDFFGESGSSQSAGSRIDALAEKGKEVTSRFSSRADELLGRQKEISTQLGERTDALKRANDALKEVQSLLNNPLYNGMPDLTGEGAAWSGGGKRRIPERDPSLKQDSLLKRDTLLQQAFPPKQRRIYGRKPWLCRHHRSRLLRRK